MVETWMSWAGVEFTGGWDCSQVCSQVLKVAFLVLGFHRGVYLDPEAFTK